MDLEAFREQLVVWGITPQVLAGIGLAAVITLFFSLRIVAKWFFGIQQLHDELTLVRKQLSDLQAQLMLASVTVKNDLIDDEIEKAANHQLAAPKSESFRLTNH